MWVSFYPTELCLLQREIEQLSHVFLNVSFRGAWVAQSVGRLTSAQVMISQLVSLSPTSGSMLTARSLELASDSVSPSLCPSPAHILCLSLSKSTLKKKKERKKGKGTPDGAPG